MDTEEPGKKRKIHHINTRRWEHAPKRWEECCLECGADLSKQPCLSLYIPVKGCHPYPNYWLCLPCMEAFAAVLQRHSRKLTALTSVDTTT